ncbi:hypothetical protein CDAR_167591 [Caerostris darwini]|uniref:Uncharacterized protein n=1 Tax=Caerostris darwini TaxID=1538125 RepID=A0AAV4M700_9ARAC|nr:hypothetical protein CDAR_167591 [Caerostris darwini]
MKPQKRTGTSIPQIRCAEDIGDRETILFENEGAPNDDETAAAPSNHHHQRPRTATYAVSINGPRGEVAQSFGEPNQPPGGGGGGEGSATELKRGLDNVA